MAQRLRLAGSDPDCVVAQPAPEESQSYLAQRGVPPAQHSAVLGFTHGHPLALSLVADVAAQGGDIGSARRKGAAWQIGIQDPRRQTGDAIAVAQLTSGALATSGDYLHTFTPDFRVHHILDPRTGLSPLELSSVSIVAPNACLADALSTGVMVLGAQLGLSLVERLPDVECLLVTKTGEVIRSEGFPMEA